MIVSDLNSLDCTALILAGGQARRFNGKDKGLLPYNDHTFIEHIAHKFPSTWPVFALTHQNQAQYQALGITCIDDESLDHKGPMIAVPAACKHVTTEFIVVSACDTPNIPLTAYAPLLHALSDSCNAAYIATEEREHYCCLVAKTEVLKSLSEAPRSMRHLLGLINAVKVNSQLDEHLFQNINSADDLNTLVKTQ